MGCLQDEFPSKIRVIFHWTITMGEKKKWSKKCEQEHTLIGQSPSNADCERNPFMAWWERLPGVRSVDTTLDRIQCRFPYSKNGQLDTIWDVDFHLVWETLRTQSSDISDGEQNIKTPWLSKLWTSFLKLRGHKFSKTTCFLLSNHNFRNLWDDFRWFYHHHITFPLSHPRLRTRNASLQLTTLVLSPCKQADDPSHHHGAIQ